MRWTRQVCFDGDSAAVFGLASDLARWPHLFPHVRYTHKHENTMWEIGYERWGVPVRCVCRLEVTPTHRNVRLVHVGGPCRGLAEQFVVEGTTLLRYTCATGHTPRLVQQLAARQLLVPFAERTLAMIDLLATAERRASAPGTASG